MRRQKRQRLSATFGGFPSYPRALHPGIGFHARAACVMASAGRWTYDPPPMHAPLPASLEWLQGLPEGRAWRARVPRLVDEVARAWSLTLGEPFPYAFASLALPATTPGGEPAVLKLQFPDREVEHEATALRLLDGHGARP